MVEGVVGRADEWAGFHVLEAHLLAEVFVFGKLIGVDETDYGKMIFRGLQVLA